MDLAVVRQLKDGTLDTTFGKGGKVTLNIYELTGASLFIHRHDHDIKRDDSLAESAGSISATPIAQQDGKIVLVSTVHFDFNNVKGVVIRLNKDGSLDTSFHRKGFLLVELPGIEHVWNYASGVAVQQDGKVLVCGHFNRTPDDSSPDAYVMRYGESGNIDSNYGDNGVVIVADTHRLELSSMTLKPDGGIIATGYTLRNEQGLIVSLNVSGSFNLVFNDGKPLFSDFLDEGLSWRRSILQEDGKILVLGQGGGVFFEKNSSMVTARYLADGSLDKEFGDGGLVVFNDKQGVVLYRGGALMSDNRVVVCGYVIDPTNPLWGSVVRY
ncbi:hypothetical protein ACLD1X_29085, partial [Pseudomonas sp. 18173]